MIIKINYKNKYLNHNLNLDLFQLVKSLKKLNSHNRCFEYSDQMRALETLINTIAEGKIPFDSINFKKICTQLRLLLPKEKVKYINKKGSQITIQFPEQEVKITKKEYMVYHDYINNNEVLRRIFGLESSNHNAFHNGIQLIPVITVPVMNLPAFQEILSKVPQQKLLFFNNENIVLPNNSTAEKSIDNSFIEQIDNNNSVLNTYFMLDNADPSAKLLI